MRAPSVCNVHGCTNPAPHGQGKCDTHHAQAKRTAWRNADANRPSANARGYDQRWRTTRAQYLHAHPTCVDCGSPATDVDHIDGAGPLAPHGHDWANLQALCHPCHTRKTNTHDGGGWARTTRPTA